MTAAALVAFSPLFPAAHTSPPSGLDGVPPAAGTGIRTMPKSVPALASCGSCHGPLTIMATVPLANCSSTLAWVHDSTSFGAAPEATRSVSSCSADTAWGESSVFRSAPALKKNDSNWKLPSSVAGTANPMPYRLVPLVSFPAVAFNSSQVAGRAVREDARPPAR
nr:hypothetical protein [Microtetraspora sp. NBRC 13810]